MIIRKFLKGWWIMVLVVLFTSACGSKSSAPAPDEPVPAEMPVSPVTSNSDAINIDKATLEEWAQENERVVLAPVPQPPKPASIHKEAPSGEVLDEMPIFNWPPPRATSSYAIPLRFFSLPPSSLREADVMLSDALRLAGYREKQYYKLPPKAMPGFVLVTRIEAINADGSPKQQGRWPEADLSLLANGSNFSIKNFLKVLLNMEAGHYRVIAFVFTPQAVRQNTNKQVTAQEAEDWLKGGWSSLPPEIGQQPFSDTENFCTVLVYEFEKRTNKGEAKFKTQGIDAWDHLKGTGISLENTVKEYPK